METRDKIKEWFIDNKVRIIGVGAAGSGKDYFKDYLHSIGFPVDVSYTTRPMRSGEVNGYTYNYVKQPTFDNLVNRGLMYESVKFNGWSYGTAMVNWNLGGYFIMTPSGVDQIDPNDSYNTVVVYFDIDEKVRRQRVSTRSDADSTDRRIEADNKDFEKFQELCNMFPFTLTVNYENYNPETLFLQIHSIVQTN